MVTNSQRILAVSTFIPQINRDWLWVAGLASGLALITVSLGHPVGRLGFSVLWLVLTFNYSRIWAEYKADKGSWWLFIPLGVIGISALIHAIAGRTLYDLMGLLVVVMCYGIYLLARSLRDRFPQALAIMSALGSVSIIISRVINPYSSWNGYRPGLFGIYHITCFVILVGIIVAPPRTRTVLLLIGIPAMIMSSSEEGIACLVVLGVVALLKRDWNRRAVAGVVAMGVIVAILLFSGWFQAVYPRLNADRVSLNADTITHERWVAYQDFYASAPILTGGGWEWNSVGSQEATSLNWPPKWQTIHNAPLRVIGHFGIMAGLAWLFVMSYGLWRYRRTKYAYLFVTILVFSMVDHMLWSYMPVWPWALLGLVYIRKENVASTKSSTGDVKRPDTRLSSS